MAKRVLNQWRGYTAADCDCKYCLYYGGRKKGEVNCLAEECVSEVFFSVAKNFKKVNNLTSYEKQKYVVISIRNRAFNILSKEKNNNSNVPYEDDVYFNDKDYYEFSYDQWVCCIRKLNKTDRDILYLVCVQGMDYKEIADSFGISYAAAKQRYWTAKNNLKKIILKEGEI